LTDDPNITRRRLSVVRLLAGASFAVALLCAAGCGRSDTSSEGGADARARSEEGRSAAGTAAPDWGEPQGRWHGQGWMEVSLEEEKSLTPEQRQEFARLRSLGYLPGSSPVPANTGVIVYDGRRTADGLNFHTSGHAPVAILTSGE
jgi:hypothetical protein